MTLQKSTIRYNTTDQYFIGKEYLPLDYIYRITSFFPTPAQAVFAVHNIASLDEFPDNNLMVCKNVGKLDPLYLSGKLNDRIDVYSNSQVKIVNNIPPVCKRAYLADD